MARSGITLTREVNNTPILLNTIRQLKTKRIEIGVFSSQGGFIMMIANVNEFGFKIKVTKKMRAYFMYQFIQGNMPFPLSKKTTHITIPKRSFIKGAAINRRKEIGVLLTPHLDKLIQNQITINQFYIVIGEVLVGVTKDYMTDIKRPKNHPFTLKKKNPKTNPLIDTGRLRGSITWRVV